MGKAADNKGTGNQTDGPDDMILLGQHVIHIERTGQMVKQHGA